MSDVMDYSLKETFNDFRSEVRSDLARIEELASKTAKEVSDIKVEQAKQVGKLSVLVILLGGAATTVGMIIGNLVLGGAK